MPRATARAVAALLCVGAQAAPAIEISRVTTHVFGHDDFVRLGEYFTGGEDAGRRTIVRTDNLQRSGYYLVVDLDEPLSGLASGSAAVLDYVTSASGEQQRLEFPLDAGKGRTLLIGLTGPEWDSLENPLLAWRVSLIGPGGEELASRHSFLWQMPQ